MSKLDEQGRPFPPTTWGDTGDMPQPGHYRVKLVRPGGLWLPACVRWEQGVDPDTRRLMDRWNPVLRILGWAWVRWEMVPWRICLHPVTRREFDLACARPLQGDPLAAHDVGESPLAI